MKEKHPCCIVCFQMHNKLPDQLQLLLSKKLHLSQKLGNFRGSRSHKFYFIFYFFFGGGSNYQQRPVPLKIIVKKIWICWLTGNNVYTSISLWKTIKVEETALLSLLILIAYIKIDLSNMHIILTKYSVYFLVWFLWITIVLTSPGSQIKSKMVYNKMINELKVTTATW